VLIAKNLLLSAEELIEILKSPNNGRRLIEDKKLRQEAPLISLDILEQKLLLHRGLLLSSFKSKQFKDEAKETFLKCINTGKNHYDARIRYECGRQLKQILLEQGEGVNIRLERLLGSFKLMHRDFIFLICDSSKKQGRSGRSMEDHKQEVKHIVTNILKNNSYVEPLDRIALIKFSNNSKRVFSLVEKEKNFK